jgi:hypothetical protein
MAGQAVGSLSNTKSAIMEVCERGGISDMETSAIGGSGRKGSDGYGKNMAAPHKNIADEFMKREGGNASTGQTGPNSGFGKSF